MTNRGHIDEAPTPQNTPASVSGSYIQKAALPQIPSTISEIGEDTAQLMRNPMLLALMQDHLQGMVGMNSGYVDNLPLKVKQRVYGLKALEQDQFDLEAKFQMELLELERKFAKEYKVVNDKRRAIVVGDKEVTPEQIEKGKELLDEEDTEEEEEKEKEEEEEKDVKGIPGFWLTCLQNIPPVETMITQEDINVLESLIDIRLEYLNTPGFKLIFEFEKNDYFSDKELVKTYYYQKELGYTGDFIYDKSEGCTIDWKSNEVNPTVVVEQKKQRNKNTKQVRIVEKTTHVASFFNFFNPPQLPDEEIEKEENEEEEEDDDEEFSIEEKLQMDYLVGELMKDKLIPRAIDCFTGDALSNGLFDFEEQDFEEDEEEEDYEEDDDDEEEEEGDDNEEGDGVEHKPPQQECKQQ
ncbi:histone chaperone [Martiniozyma asiatica (nom. inval.)]|nr:histone chaperone [Martiniozyma asiatica]